MASKTSRFVFVFLLLLVLIAGQAVLHSFPGNQNQEKKKALEEKKKKLQQEIAYNKKLLETIKGDRKKSLLQLAILNNKIKDREELIKTLASEISVLNNQISETKTSIRQTEDQIQDLKEEYAQMVVLAYKNRNSYDRLMFIFASDDFNQAYKRLKYFEEYSHHRKLRAKELDQFRQILSSKVQDLEAKRKEHAKLLGENESEKNALAGEKEEKVGLISSLKNKEKELQDEVKQKNLQALKIKKEIDKIIEEELKKLQPKKPKAGDNKKPVAPKITLTPEEELVNSGFEGNRGKLPWPTREGVITQYFGTYQHPEVPGVELNNNGIDITTNKGAEIRAIYDGEVVVAGALGGIPGMVIIIKHGEYFSVYQGLESVSVKKGDKVKTKQSIGKAFTDDDNKTGVHFELYKGKLLLNPQHWISKG